MEGNFTSDPAIVSLRMREAVAVEPSISTQQPYLQRVYALRVPDLAKAHLLL